MPAVGHRGAGSRRRTISEINMVPFIDVMLVLLIIFMVTAPLIAPSVIDLPSVGKAARQPDQIIQILITKEDSLELKVANKTAPQTLKTVAAAVKNAQRDAGNAAVVISADRNVRYDSVVKVMDTLQRAGVQRVGLSVQTSN